MTSRPGLTPSMFAWRWIAALWLGAALSAATCDARADDLLLVGSGKTLVSSIPGHPALTWGMALKLFLPDVHVGTEGTIEATSIANARRIDSADDVAADGAFHLTWLSARDVVEGGRPRLLIFAEVDQSLSGRPGSALLALIDAGSELRLLDLVDVGNDRENYLEDGPTMQIGPGSDLIVVSSAHLDAGADYAIRTALFVDRDRFASVASVWLTSLSLCGYVREQDATFAARPDSGLEFGSLEVAVTERAKRVEEECDPAPPKEVGVKAWRATFRWNSAKRTFETTSKELDAFAKHNEEDP